MAKSWRKVDEGYLSCRLFGHVWDRAPNRQPIGRRYLAGERITLECLRCSTIREEVWSRATGECIQRRYDYPEGYKYELPGTEAAPQRPDLRVEWVRRGYTVRVRKGPGLTVVQGEKETG